MRNRGFYSYFRPRRRRWPWVLLGLVALIIVPLVGLVLYLSRPVHHYTAHIRHQGWLSGVYAGHEPSKDEAFAKWRGSEIQVAPDFMGANGWLQFKHPLLLSLAWRRDYAVQLVLSVPMWPASGGSLAAAATGAYHGDYRALASTLVRDGRASTVVRLGWEFNTPFFRWQTRTAAQAAQYAQAWRQAVRSMRAVAGQHFTFVWNPNLANGGVDPARGYPGDSYVDDVGLDVYDRSLQPGETVTQRWDGLVHQRYGLQWQADFAAAHHKPIAFPEWGLVHDPAIRTAGEDDPLFITKMHAWFASHDTAFECYFDDSSAHGAAFDINGGEFPNAAAAYRRLFGD